MIRQSGIKSQKINMIDKVAVVTGANKGIGYGVVKELCRRGVKTVYLTARDIKRGTDAVASLKKEGYNPKFHQLEITDEESIKKFCEFIKQQHKGIDILINNAAVTQDNFNAPLYEDAKRVIDVNFHTIIRIEKFIFPLLNDNARVVNVSSDCGHLSKLKNKYWIERLSRKDLTLEDVEEFVNWFLDSVNNKTLKVEDFKWNILHAYVVSKIALCAYTWIQQRKIDRGISINALHPGFVTTSMTRNCGLLSVEEASDAPVYLALDADQSLKGKYIWFDKTEKDWYDVDIDIDYVDPDTFQDFVEKMSA
ncbi:unnamed protein product [Leptosia nina]|uniref:Uncharacterized protein n=1 Tax=Leptosia nina TaxID=320188 RepID=A0AAV1IYV8_9NEOP